MLSSVLGTGVKTPEHPTAPGQKHFWGQQFPEASALPLLGSPVSAGPARPQRTTSISLI